MSSTRMLRRFLASMLLVLPLISCDSGGPTDPDGKDRRPVQLTLADATVVPGQVVLVSAAEPLFTAQSYDGSVAELGAVRFERVDSTTLTFVLPPGTPTGSYKVDLSTNAWRATLGITVLEAEHIPDPDALVDAAIADVDVMIAEIQTMAADPTLPLAEGLDLVMALSAELETWRDTASAETRAGVAAMLAANPGLLAAADGTLGGAAVRLNRCDDTNLNPSSRLVACQTQASLSIGQATVSLIAAGALCYFEPTKLACPISGAIAITAIVLAKGWAVKMVESPGVATNTILTKFEEDLDFGAPQNAGRMSGASDADTLRSGIDYRLDVEAEFRSMIAGDESLHTIIATGISAVDQLRGIWARATRVVNAVRDLLSGNVPTFPPPPPDVGNTPFEMMIASLPAAGLSIENVTGPASVYWHAADSTIVATTTQPNAVPVSFDVVYDYIFGTVRSSATATVLPPAYALAFEDGPLVTDTVTFTRSAPRTFVLATEDGNPAEGIDYAQVTVASTSDDVSFSAAPVGGGVAVAITATTSSSFEVTAPFDVLYRGVGIQTIQSRIIPDIPLNYSQNGVFSFYDFTGNHTDGCQYSHILDGGNASVRFGELAEGATTRSVSITVSGTVQLSTNQEGCTDHDAGFTRTFTGTANEYFQFDFTADQQFLGWTSTIVTGSVASTPGAEGYRAYVMLDFYPGYGGQRPRTEFSVAAVR